VAIFLYLLPLAPIAPWLTWVAFAVMLAAVLITVWTGVEYVIQALKVRSEGLRRRAADQDKPNQDIPNQEGQP
jgi:CDP-diacylglycerol--glycerol-3-phosphate 3-phosphatidyltransferase/cardiolipin synthase